MSDSFDPDAYLKSKKAAGFDPNTYLEQAKINRGYSSPTEGIPAEPPVPDRSALDARSVTGTAMRSFGEGGSFWFADELSGLMGAGDEYGRRARTAMGATGGESVPVENPESSLVDALAARYRRERDASRQEAAAGARTNPRAAVVGEVAGMLANPTPLGKTKGLLSAAKTAGAIGAVSALGASDADLTRGDVAGAVADTGAGALTGAATGAALYPVAKGIRWGAQKLQGRAAEVRADKLGQIEGALDKDIASARGDLGSATQAGSRTHENILRAIQSGAPIGNTAISPETQGRAMLALSDPEFKRMADLVANNSIDSVGARTTAIQTAKDRLQSLVSNRDSEAAKQLQQYFAPGQVMSQEVVPRTKTLATNAALGLIPGGLAAGGAVASGHPDYALPALGTALITSMGGGTGLKRMLVGARGLASSPRVQNAALKNVAEMGSQAAQRPLNALTQQAGKGVAKSKDQRDEEAIQAWLDASQ